MTQYVREFAYVDELVDKTQKYSGWQLCNTPAFDPMIIPYGVIHDAMEHFTVGESTIEQEMMAIGSLYHIRILGKWWDQFNIDYNPVELVAWDIARFLKEKFFVIDSCDRKCPSELSHVARELEAYGVSKVDEYYSPGYCAENPSILDSFRRAIDWVGGGIS